MRALVWTSFVEECREGERTEGTCEGFEGIVREAEAALAASGLELTVVYGSDGGRSVRSTALAIDELAQPTPAVLVEVGVTGDLPEEPA